MNKMKYYQSLLLTLLIVFIQFCSQNIAEKGEQAYLAKDYNDAIKLLTSSSLDPQKRTNHTKEIIVLAYMYRGQELYLKTRNVKSFSGNYKSSYKYLPETQSSEFRLQYSALLSSLAAAYSEAKAENEFEQDKFDSKGIELVNTALSYDSTNDAAHKLLGRLKEKNFLKLLSKSNTLYIKAKKLDDVDLYFAAEACLNDAAKYDVNNPDLLNLRKKIKRSTLGILNYSDGVSMAVTDQVYDKGKLVMLLAVKNYQKKPVSIQPDKIELIDVRGNTYPVDKEEMRVRSIFGQKCIESKKLDPNNPYTKGIVAFDVPKNLAISHIVLKNNGDIITSKYFQ